MRALAVLAVILLAGCGGATPPASLSLDELDELAADIESRIPDVDEAFCDAGGGDPMAICYIGIPTASIADAQNLICDEVVQIAEEWTSGSVDYIAFDSRDDQTIGFADC